jgi:hypothetical protein
MSLSSIARAGRRGGGFWLGLGFELSTDVLRAGRPGPAEIDAGYVLFAVGGKGSGNTEGRFRTVRELEGGRTRQTWISGS